MAGGGGARARRSSSWPGEARRACGGTRTKSKLGGAASLYGRVRGSPRKAFEQLARRVQACLRGYQYEVKAGRFVLARYRCTPDASVSYTVLEVRSPLSRYLGLLRFEMAESGGA